MPHATAPPRPHAQRPRLGALLIGLLFCAGAIAILLEDAALTGRFTLDHALQVVVVIGTIAAGHVAWSEAARWRLHTAAALALLAAVGSFWCVYQTAGRNAQHATTQRAEAADTSERRRTLSARLASAEQMLADARARAAAECAGGKGRRCDGAVYSAGIYEAAADGFRARLAELPPRAAPSARTDTAAALIVSLPWVVVSHETVAAALTMWEPLIPSLFLEFGAIVFIAIGWPAPGNRCPAPRATVATMETVQQPSPPARRAAPVDRTRAEADLVTLLALGQPLPSQETLAQRWRVGKGTVSKWLAAWEARGLVSRHPEGRRKRVAARTGG